MTTLEQLRRETSEAHHRLEATPLAEALAAARVGRAEYVAYLQALAVVVETLRAQLVEPERPVERLLAAHLDRWAPLLRADLDELSTATSPASSDANRAARRLARGIRRGYVDGIAYVMFGSHRGNRVVAPRVEEALGRGTGEGTRYLRAAEGADGWPELCALLDRSPETEEEQEAALAGARSAFEIFEEIMKAIVPGALDRVHVSAFNPEAGDHPIPRRPELVDLAVRVADRAFRHFPYLEFRFGARGERFSRSDGAWLLTLCELNPATAERQADWLARVLSSRGIPTICLEAHLSMLDEALADEAIEVEGAEILARLAERLRARREALAPLAGAPPIQVPALGDGLGEVLLSAAADQIGGLAPCADEIRGWAAAEERLGSEERRAIVSLLEQLTEGERP